MVVGVPGRLERLDAQAAGLERALDDLEPVALDELVVAGDVVVMRVRRQQVGDRQPLALDGLVQRSERRAAVDEHGRAARLVGQRDRRSRATRVHAPLDQHSVNTLGTYTPRKDPERIGGCDLSIRRSAVSRSSACYGQSGGRATRSVSPLVTVWAATGREAALAAAGRRPKRRPPRLHPRAVARRPSRARGAGPRARAPRAAGTEGTGTAGNATGSAGGVARVRAGSGLCSGCGGRRLGLRSRVRQRRRRAAARRGLDGDRNRSLRRGASLLRNGLPRRRLFRRRRGDRRRDRCGCSNADRPRRAASEPGSRARDRRCAGTLALTLTATTAAPTAPAALGVRLNDSRRENSVVSGKSAPYACGGSSSSRSVRRARNSSICTEATVESICCGDLVVREACDLAEEERLALLGRQRRERLEQRARLLVRLLGGERGIRVERLLARAAERGAEAPAPHVLGDRQQPGARRLRTRASQHRAVGVDERRLGDVLGVLAVAERAQRRPVDVVAMPAVQLLEGALRIGTGVAQSPRRHALTTPARGKRVRSTAIPSQTGESLRCVPSCSPRVLLAAVPAQAGAAVVTPADPAEYADRAAVGLVTENGTRTPVALLGARGLLTSDSTRIDGLVTAEDVAAGRLRVVPDADPAAALRTLDRRIERNDRWHLPLTIALAVLLIGLALVRPPLALRALLVVARREPVAQPRARARRGSGRRSCCRSASPARRS